MQDFDVCRAAYMQALQESLSRLVRVLFEKLESEANPKGQTQ